jgi:hypothetical protein
MFLSKRHAVLEGVSGGSLFSGSRLFVDPKPPPHLIITTSIQGLHLHRSGGNVGTKIFKMVNLLDQDPFFVNTPPYFAKSTGDA